MLVRIPFRVLESVEENDWVFNLYFMFKIDNVHIYWLATVFPQCLPPPRVWRGAASWPSCWWGGAWWPHWPTGRTRMWPDLPWPDPAHSNGFSGIFLRKFGSSQSPLWGRLLKQNMRQVCCDIIVMMIPASMRTFPMRSSPVLNNRSIPARRKQSPTEPR